MKAVTFHSTTEQELVEAIAWYRERSESAAKGLLDELKVAISNLQRWPLRAPIVDHTAAGTEIRRLRLQRYPYALVYVDIEDELRIIAFTHLRRIPGYWASRQIDEC